MDKKVFIDIISQAVASRPEFSANALWTSKLINSFPDSSFAVVEKGGKKDAEGKIEPRNYRHLPYKDAEGKVDLPHLRNALARMNQIVASSDKDTTERIRAVARRVLIAAAKKSLPDSQFAKGEIFGTKASIVSVDQVGDMKYVDVTMEIEALGYDGKMQKMSVTMPFDLKYDADGKLTNVKFYWQEVPGIVLEDFANFLKTLVS